MPDISMCQDHNCPLKEKCYRYRAIPSQWQSYSIPDREGKKCKDFMSILEGDRLSVVEWEGGVPSISNYNIATGKVDEVIKELEDNGFEAIDITGKKWDAIKPLVKKYRKDIDRLEAFPPLLLNDVSGRTIQTEWIAWNVNFGAGASKEDKMYLPVSVAIQAKPTVNSMKANGGLISDLPDDVILAAGAVARGTLKIESVVKVWQDDVSALAKMIAETEYAEQGLPNVARAKMVRYLLTKQGDICLPFKPTAKVPFKWPTRNNT